MAGTASLSGQLAHGAPSPDPRADRRSCAVRGSWRQRRPRAHVRRAAACPTGIAGSLGSPERHLVLARPAFTLVQTSPLDHQAPTVTGDIATQARSRRPGRSPLVRMLGTVGVAPARSLAYDAPFTLAIAATAGGGFRRLWAFLQGALLLNGCVRAIHRRSAGFGARCESGRRGVRWAGVTGDNPTDPKFHRPVAQHPHSLAANRHSTRPEILRPRRRRLPPPISTCKPPQDPPRSTGLVRSRRPAAGTVPTQAPTPKVRLLTAAASPVVAAPAAPCPPGPDARAGPAPRRRPPKNPCAAGAGDDGLSSRAPSSG